MKAIELLEYAKKYDAHITNEMIDDAIEEIQALKNQISDDPQRLIRQLFRDLAMQEEVIKNNKAKLEELQSRGCESCKYQADSNEGAWCIVLDIEIISPSFCCNRYKDKEE